MRFFEVVATLFSILGGFWMLCQKLTRIEIAITKKVGYSDCRVRQENCRCHKDIEDVWAEINENHPRKKGGA